MYRHVRCLVAATLLLAGGCTPPPATSLEGGQCASVEHLPTDSAEAQLIVRQSVANFKKNYPAEYMGMAVLHRVDRLGEWAVLTGSVAGEGKDIIVARQSQQGYQIAERMHIVPLDSPAELEELVTKRFLQGLPEAPQALFTCLDQTWLLASAFPNESPATHQLAYVATDDGTTDGVTEIRTLRSNGSNQSVLLHQPMLIMGLAPSPDGEQMAFWGCPGSLANDCMPGEDLDVWSVNWDGSRLRNLTVDSTDDDSHPDWSPDGTMIVFDSSRSGKSEIYVMRADGSSVRQLTDSEEDNQEPKWSPNGDWVAYHCRQGFQTRICVISPDGQPAGQPIPGTTPEWSPAGSLGQARLAFLCFDEGHSDICLTRPDGSNTVRLTGSLSDEHSAAWSPDGGWLALVSNLANDVDIYKVCATCPLERTGEPLFVRLTDEPQAAGQPAWSPDGSQVTYTDEAGALMLVNADRSDATYLAGGAFGRPVWRPQHILPSQ